MAGKSRVIVDQRAQSGLDVGSPTKVGEASAKQVITVVATLEDNQCQAEPMEFSAMQVKKTMLDYKAGFCVARTKTGRRCTARATASGRCFFHADPIRAAELGRLGGTRNRRALPISDEGQWQTPSTVADVKLLLADAIAAVRSGRLDPKTGATLAFMANPLLKAIELAELEDRLTRLEQEDRDESPKTN